MKLVDGRVIKAVASKFFVDTPEGVKVCFARKRLKNDGIIFVGDFVTVEKGRGDFVIEEVKPRKNQLIRPYVSNIDVCFIVISPEPEPDFVLVDKIIINCLEQCITPVLVKNKDDLSQIDTSEYDGVVKQFICSALTGEGVGELVDFAKGKTVCFAGQSAVGKSSLINAILDSDLLEVGELAKKIKRGKNTTRKTEIFNL
ncbi:MAG: ribosome small subunit-dependent GTPase A, partial [Clostridia bacterium]|nr:ribosome small subunit-dependent GTPase A [Clostridia bacterium]